MQTMRLLFDSTLRAASITSKQVNSRQLASHPSPRKSDGMVAAISIVGDEPMLLQTRAELLREWQVSTSTSQRAFQAVHAAAYDLLIICQTVSDTTAGQLIDKARQMNPYVLALAISQVGQERNLNVELFEVQ
jgi:hypothetical protein